MTARRLSPDEQALWRRVVATVNPLDPAHLPPVDAVAATPAPPVKGKPASTVRGAAPPRPTSSPTPRVGTTLDGGWDRRLATGRIAPDSSIDLHGHTLDSAYRALDEHLGRAVARGDRVVLLVTGKPPRAESERPHARGRIRAAVGDWLAASRHAGSIATVRSAHPRHGDSGALYIVLRRRREERNY